MVLYGLFGWLLVYFSTSPTYHFLQPGMAELRVVFNHAAQPVSPCHRRTAEELAKLPPNMRKAVDCPRQRVHVRLEVVLDGQMVAKKSYEPSGFSDDGPAFVYGRFPVPAGTHRIRLMLKDKPDESVTYEDERVMEMPEGRSLVVNLDETSGHFRFR
ncbi:MAG: hypothetical protein HQL64_16945 [Magnetococcales bacterium]|nr:hypothetical protein [Magnetococcales bacterium]